MDALDPALAPGVSHNEPGGFATKRVVETLFSLQGEVGGTDIVESNPHRDVMQITENACARLAQVIAATMLAGSQRVA
jgi:arginase